jgi:phospholipase C
MRCFHASSLPILSTLTQQFAVCDRWFSSVPASTIPNRLFAHAAYSGLSLTQDAVILTDFHRYTDAYREKL